MNSSPEPDARIKCPATGFTKSCKSIVAKCICPKFVTLAGLDPQTGKPLNTSACVDSLLPTLLLENSQQTRQLAADIESFRNEVVRTEAQKLDAVRSLVGGRHVSR